MVIKYLICILVIILISCKPTNLENPGDPHSIAGNLTRILLSGGGSSVSSTNTEGSENSATISNAQTNSETNSGSATTPSYNIIVRVNNMAGAAGSANIQVSLNGAPSVAVSTTGNAVRDHTFSNQVAAGAGYIVNVTSQPSVGFRVCNIPTPAGVMPAYNIIVVVYCFGTNPSGGSGVTVGNTVGDSQTLNFSLDGNPGSTVAINLGSVSADFTFDAGGLNSAHAFGFTTANFSTAQSVSVFRRQVGVSSNINVTYSLTPFTQLAQILLSP
ncbi:MAG: hypothetical protein SH817_06085 [Leptospira sp.]|nr:hypothetical protein [Leptospira sp.]